MDVWKPVKAPPSGQAAGVALSVGVMHLSGHVWPRDCGS